MNYQPHLYVFNVGFATPEFIYHVIDNLGFGKIRYVEINKGCAFVAMDYWDITNTTATRMKLYDGKSMRLYYTETQFWKVYAYDRRHNEEKKNKMDNEVTHFRAIAERHRIERERIEKEKERVARIKVEKNENKYRQRKDMKERNAEKYRRKDDSNDYKSIREKDNDDFDIDDAKTSIKLDYGNAAEMYPAIKQRAKKIFDKLKNKH